MHRPSIDLQHIMKSCQNTKFVMIFLDFPILAYFDHEKGEKDEWGE